MKLIAGNICFATNNVHKLAEVKALSFLSANIQSLKEIGCFEDLPETHDTIEENSMEKAMYVFQKYNVPCFADDSGLEVTALNNAPGVHSALYAGNQRNDQDNIDLLLNNMKTVSHRNAQFKTVITFIISLTQIRQFEGLLQGTIIKEKRGNNGFGYDPVFVPLGQTKTLAEMSQAEKTAISHRSNAMNRLFHYFYNCV